MSVTAPSVDVPETPRPALEVATLMTIVLGIMVKRIPKILLLALPAGLAMGGLLYLGFSVLESWWIRFRLDILMGFAVIAVSLGTGLALMGGPMAQALDEYERKGTLSLRPAFARLFTRLIPALCCAILTAAMTLVPLWLVAEIGGGRVGLFLGAVAIAAGMYGTAFWGLSVPIIPIERLGLRALGRSRALGEGYRWPIAGTCFMFVFTAVLLSGLIGAGLAMIARLIMFEWLNLSSTNYDLIGALAFVDLCIVLMLMISMVSLGLAAIRRRLIAIKEPPDIEDMIAVFD